MKFAHLFLLPPPGLTLLKLSKIFPGAWSDVLTLSALSIGAFYFLIGFKRG